MTTCADVSMTTRAGSQHDNTEHSPTLPPQEGHAALIGCEHMSRATRIPPDPLQRRGALHEKLLRPAISNLYVQSRLDARAHRSLHGILRSAQNEAQLWALCGQCERPGSILARGATTEQGCKRTY